MEASPGVIQLPGHLKPAICSRHERKAAKVRCHGAVLPQNGGQLVQHVHQDCISQGVFHLSQAGQEVGSADEVRYQNRCQAGDCYLRKVPVVAPASRENSKVVGMQGHEPHWAENILHVVRRL